MKSKLRKMVKVLMWPSYNKEKKLKSDHFNKRQPMYIFFSFTPVNESTRIAGASSKKAWQYDNLTMKPYQSDAFEQHFVFQQSFTVFVR